MGVKFKHPGNTGVCLESRAAARGEEEEKGKMEAGGKWGFRDFWSCAASGIFGGAKLGGKWIGILKTSFGLIGFLF